MDSAVTHASKGKVKEGVFATFIAGTGNELGGMFSSEAGGSNTPAKSINVPLAFEETPVVEWLDVKGKSISESDFIKYLKDTFPDEKFDSYDYKKDPKGLKAPDETTYSADHPVYRVTGDVKYKYFINQRMANGEWVDYFSVPVRSGFIFTNWKVTGKPVSPVTFSGGPDDPFDTRSWNVILDKELKKRNGAYITLVAAWTENPELARAKVDLQTQIDDIRQAGKNPDYVDDYVLGSVSSDAKLKELQELVSEAEVLLAGEEKKAEIDLSGMEGMQTEDTVEEGDGGKDAPVEIKFVLYDVEKMAAKKAKIAELLADEATRLAVQSNGGFVSTTASIGYPADGKYKYTSVTIAADGLYEIELWGASGGAVWSRNNKTALGGSGAYVKARLKLSKDDVLKFFVGGEGEGSAIYNPTTGHFTKNSTNYHLGKKGGLPNGGNGDKSYQLKNGNKYDKPDFAGGSGGGGSTDVRLLKKGYTEKKQGNIGPYADIYDSTLDKRILVAGGGGGAAQGREIKGSWPGMRGGNAGGPGYSTGGKQENRTLFSTSNKDGRGVNAVHNSSKTWEGPAGGGGGYYGGGAITVDADPASGGGGTSYITSDAEKDDQKNELSGSYGNGRASIKWIK
ncbi:MAG: hypothetical protein LBO04_03015 [Spirochaetaceae bacterium]|nr:hypothetical protein [Spirochaetaceae bacterium]